MKLFFPRSGTFRRGLRNRARDHDHRHMRTDLTTRNELLSIIVPVLNERQRLPGLLNNLQEQQGVAAEILICDGGSTDGSREWLQQAARGNSALRIVEGPPGRAQQMNRGATAARGQWLLFLHADSCLPDTGELAAALELLCHRGAELIAGHFRLKFTDTDGQHPQAYYYYAWKARLGRAETIHGDQGFLVPRTLFDRVGGFRENLAVMEDTDFAERLRQIGQWQLLPGEILTSARRFSSEGLRQRQLLGALMMCFRQIGWDDFFQHAPELYRQQSDTKTLQLLPFFQLIAELLAGYSAKRRWALWSAAGSYVRDHGWQVLFALDARRAFRQGLAVGTGRHSRLDFGEPIYHFVTGHPPGRFCATLALRIWFAVTFWRLSRKPETESAESNAGSTDCQ